jgi:hypothetical protein
MYARIPQRTVRHQNQKELEENTLQKKSFFLNVMYGVLVVLVIGVQHSTEKSGSTPPTATQLLPESQKRGSFLVVVEQ